ncbi:MAG TPA: TonB family protein [Steroidobacteraceae bacterium]|nr:TonB family protein [Steroidobacteraceae bacterium]
MRNGVRTGVACGVLLAVQLNVGWAQDRPSPGSVVAAHPAWRYDPEQRCPGLEVSPKGYGAVVDFYVSAGGAPSKAFISTSSQSDSLDAAALTCVGKLRFQPANRMGDGVPIDSWQRIALKTEDPPPQYGAPAKPAATAGAPAAATPTAGSVAAAPAAAAPAAASATGAAAATTAAAVLAPATAAAAQSPAPASSSTSVAPPATHAVETRACADGNGRVQEPTVVHSSGNAQLDQAAVNIARSGSAYLRQAAESDNKTAPRCVHMAVQFENP